MYVLYRGREVVEEAAEAVAQEAERHSTRPSVLLSRDGPEAISMQRCTVQVRQFSSK